MLELLKLQVRADTSRTDLLIDGLSLSVKRGEAVGLIGPSGCGKTTLLRSVAGLIDPAGGAVTLDGKAPGDWGWPTFRKHVMLVPQRPVVWDGTLRQNLLRPGRFRSTGQIADDDPITQMLGQVSLKNKLQSRATELSEGEKQRVCMVRALLMRPTCLLLDEPTSALDDDTVGQVEALLAERMRASDGFGVLLATHDRALAARFCSRVIDLSQFVPDREVVACG